MTQEKIVVSAADVLRQAKSHAKGGEKPSWAGQTAYVGQQAVKDWDEYESRAIGIGELASFGKLMGDNQDLLRAIQDFHPQSIADLSKSIGRAEGNVSRSLAKLTKLGVVKLIAVEGSKAKRPELALLRMRMELDVLDMTVSVHTPKMAMA
jgi:predicted transcriptional regulator